MFHVVIVLDVTIEGVPHLKFRIGRVPVHQPTEKAVKQTLIAPVANTAS